MKSCMSHDARCKDKNFKGRIQCSYLQQEKPFLNHIWWTKTTAQRLKQLMSRVKWFRCIYCRKSDELPLLGDFDFLYMSRKINTRAMKFSKHKEKDLGH